MRIEIMKTTVIYHRADFDGIFCREIAKKFLPDAEFIGWDFADKPLMTIHPGFNQKIYILDLPMDRPFGLDFRREPVPQWMDEIIWIDHHKSSIDSHPTDIPGYRIDGVAACRLAWQWFTSWPLPPKEHFVERLVNEPLAVRLAGEYDIWDKRDPRAELFQHGLRSCDLDCWWPTLLQTPTPENQNGINTVNTMLNNGALLQFTAAEQNKYIITSYGFDFQFEGLTFLACNHARYNSQLFTAGLKPHHQACLGFKWTGKFWEFSLYHAPGHEDIDLSKIAIKYGGGGHKGACGFRLQDLPDSLLGKDTHH